jgi:hypothetical protein
MLVPPLTGNEPARRFLAEAVRVEIAVDWVLARRIED